MIGNLVGEELQELIRAQQWDVLRKTLAGLPPADIAELLIDLPVAEEGIIFRVLPRDLAAEAFSYLPTPHQQELLEALTGEQTRHLLEGMTPDDRAQLLEELPGEVTRQLLDFLSPEQLRSTQALLNYPAESAGRFMTPAYVALRRDMTVAQALERIRQSPRATETLNVVYVLDEQGRLLRDLRLGTLVRALPETPIEQLQDRPVVCVPATAERDEVISLFRRYDRIALPVVNDRQQMLGIITVDDVMAVAEAEATEDMHKLGGTEALEMPYADVGFFTMLRKRGGWLSVLFLGEMLTASAMAHFEGELAAAVVLALFIPLIISSGGNSGSQAATLIIRALALRELTLRDWWRVAYRELGSGVALGCWLGALGFSRVVLWQHLGWVDYGPHYLLVGTTVWLSLIGVVCFGALTGSLLPFALRAVGFDPATCSAPFVATLVDVTGLVIYFSTAWAVLHGTLL